MPKTKPPRIVTILIVSTITIVFWVAIDVYRALAIKPADPVPGEIIAPIDPNLDETALRSLEQRVYIEEDQIQTLPEQSTAPQVTPSPSPTATVSPDASFEPTPNPSPTP